MKRKIEVDDFSRFRLIGRLSPSPDGRRALFEVQSCSITEDTYRVDLHMVDINTFAVRPFATAGSRNQEACWSRDGQQIAFVRRDSLGAQIWTMPSDGGEARRLTALIRGVSRPTWSADGRKLYACANVLADSELEFIDTSVSQSDQEANLSKRDKTWNEGSKRYDRLYYKLDGQGLSKHERVQLIEIDVATGDVRQLTHAAEDVESFSVSMDGNCLYFIRGRGNDLTPQYADLYKLDLKTLETSMICDEVFFQEIACSPVDVTIAAIAVNPQSYRDDGFAAHANVYVLNEDGTNLACLSAKFPNDVSHHTLTDLGPTVPSTQLVWSNDGTAIYTMSGHEGRGEVVKFDTDSLNGEGAAVLCGAFDVYQFAVTEEGILAACASATDPSMLYAAKRTDFACEIRRGRHPTEPMKTSYATTDVKEIYSPNEQLLAELTISEPEPFWYQSDDDWFVQGWVVRPIHDEEGRTYPIILEIHGGPHTHYGANFFHEVQWLAAQGYAVVFTNPRGSTSYGQSFVNAVRQHYGERDAADILNGLRAAIDRFAFLDGNRVAVTGGSYGGFMTNWLVGHTDQFFAAVSQRSISNWISFFGCSDIGPNFVEKEISSAGIDDLTALWKFSPLAYAENIHTPLLLIHSEQDLRCPIEQSEQLYTWLKYKERDVELLRVPNASHGLSRNGKPSLRIQRLSAIFEYIDGHLPT